MQLPPFQSAKVLVAGDIMLDRYWHGPAARISPEAPVPVVRVSGSDERLGGAGNVALNLAALGAEASLLGYCGADESGDAVARLAAAAGVECLLLRQARLPTITKLRVISRQQQLIRLDFEESFREVDPAPLAGEFRTRLASAQVVVLSDYGKGTLSEVAALIDACRAADRPVLVDPKGADFSRYRHATLLTPNLSEFEAIVGTCADQAQIEEKGRGLIGDLRLEALLITRGEHGMSLVRRDSPALHLPAHAREVFDVTGAGDTVISVLAASLAAGATLPDAVALANLAAGVVVGKLGTAAVSREELEYAVSGTKAHHRGTVDLESLLRLRDLARREGEKIVLTNGCFDILHPGHIHYLQQAKALGDRLVVLVNDDASVRRLKGQGRPINPLPHRLAMLAALECVDWVVPFAEDTPREAICRILPDILVKGGDYRSVEAIAGHDCVQAHGGEVRLLEFVEGHSTTQLIENIRNT
jgi:D-beta-D-heptose 7-phosphate kinase/D-beta-D-heptose 1-phosphate adenosyltransferase